MATHNAHGNHLAQSGWLHALEELERQLGATARDAARAVQGDSLVEAVDWNPPQNLGPLPKDLGGRVRELLAGQQELILELAQARKATARQLAAVRSVPAARDIAVSVYLDVTG